MRGSIEHGGGRREGKAQRGRKVARFKGGEKKLTDATCFEGGAWGRRGDLVGDCPGALKVVGQVVRRWNNKFYAQLSLSFLFFETRTFQFRYFFLLSFFFLFYRLRELLESLRYRESSVVSSQMLKNRKSVRVVVPSTFIRVRNNNGLKEK